MSFRWFALALVVAVGTPASAQKAPPNPLATAKSFNCAFPVYATTTWGASAQVLTGPQDFTFQIDSFDFKKGRARVISPTGSSPVSMVLSETGMNVIEQTPIGNFNLTTVFIGGAAGTKRLAAHSRHLGDVAESPRVSQAYGTCETVQ